MKKQHLRKIPIFLLGALALVGFVWWFRHSFALLVSDESWVIWLTTKESSGNILGGLVSGVLTIAAGVFTVIIYNSQHRSENLRQFLAWLADFNSAFHNDTNYSTVRLKLARERGWIRRQLIMEMLADNDIHPEEVPASERDLCGIKDLRTREIEWEFLRHFTDYLYFFEQILAFGEVLARRGARSLSPTLVNHFGWFLRSLCVCWWEDDWSIGERNRAEGAFTIYLAVNRYRRLAQVALLLRSCGEDVTPEFDAALFRRVSDILQKQTPDLHTAADYRQLEKEWRVIIGSKGFIGRGRRDPVSEMA